MTMDIQERNKMRRELNSLMSEKDDFFQTFGILDNHVYSDGIIPKKYKELTGLSISVLTRCEEYILYHIQTYSSPICTKKESYHINKSNYVIT